VKTNFGKERGKSQKGKAPKPQPRRKKQRKDLNRERWKLKELQDWFWMTCLVMSSWSSGLYII
jgi:hypothetical protein